VAAAQHRRPGGGAAHTTTGSHRDIEAACASIVTAARSPTTRWSLGAALFRLEKAERIARSAAIGGRGGGSGSVGDGSIRR
jgi:hypothetical protein